MFLLVNFSTKVYNLSVKGMYFIKTDIEVARSKITNLVFIKYIKK